MSVAKKIWCVVPGSLDVPTGGYGYDRAVIQHLRRLGWEVEVKSLVGAYPHPDARAQALAAQVFAALPNDALTLVDGLAFGALPRVASAQSHRLRLVALVHHPLADETGLEAATRVALLASEREALRHPRAVICTSESTASRLATAFAVEPMRITVAPPGTLPVPRASANNRVPALVAVGTLTPRKGHQVLLEALARLGTRPWSLRIIGDPTRDVAHAEQLRSLAGALGLLDRVQFVGIVEDPAVELAAADVFVLASRHEGYGMAFAEALAYGLPIVGCRVGAVPEVVPDGAGLLVAPDDVEALAQAIGALLDAPDRRRAMADAAWAAAQRLPRWESTVDTISQRLSAVQRGD